MCDLRGRRRPVFAIIADVFEKGAYFPVIRRPKTAQNTHISDEMLTVFIVIRKYVRFKPIVTEYTGGAIS